jgi:DNA-binding transcriptional LysR family regulator
VVLTVDSHQAVISAINHHVGMGIVASHMISKEIQSGQIIGINTSKSEIANQISMVHLKDKIPTIAEKIFETFLVKKIQSLGI